MISEFKFTPKGHLNFVDENEVDITGDTVVTFESGAAVENPGRKFLKVPDYLFGEQIVTFQDLNGQQVRSHESINDVFYTFQNDVKLSYAIFGETGARIGNFHRAQRVVGAAIEDVQVFESNNRLAIRLPFTLDLPVFFEVVCGDEHRFVNFKSVAPDTAELILDGIDLSFIDRILLIDAQFNKEYEYLVYSRDDAAMVSESFYPATIVENVLSFENFSTGIGQLGKLHVGIINGIVNMKMLHDLGNEEDQLLEIFHIEDNQIRKIRYTVAAETMNTPSYSLFKHMIIVNGQRELLDPIKEAVKDVEQLPVDIVALNGDNFTLEFKQEIATLQIFVSGNHAKGPYRELPYTFLDGQRLVKVDLQGIFDDLGVENKQQIKNMFINISFVGERQANMYALAVAGDNAIFNHRAFQQRFSLPGGVGKYEQVMQLYRKPDGGLSLLKGPLHNLVKETYGFDTRVENIAINKQHGYDLQIALEGRYITPDQVKAVRLVSRNVLNPLENDYEVSLTQEDNHLVVHTRIDTIHEYVPYYWDVFLVIADLESGYQGTLEVKKLSADVKDKIDVDVFDKEVQVDDDHILYPYLTANGSIAFTYRLLENYENQVNFDREKRAHRIYNRFKRYFDKKNIWIVFEKNSFGAHDNAFHFFKYMYENEKHPNTYYVIRKDSPEYKNLAGMQDRVLEFMSLKYFIYMFAARVFISSDTKFHSYNLQRRDSLLAKSMMSKKNVFLQHGMNGIKKVPVFHKKRGLLDLIIAPSDFERKEINIKEWRYSGDEVVATGYARWDSYVDKTAELPYHQVFMMPTWRKWMEGMTQEQFLETPFYREYQAFLSSPELKAKMIANNARLAFFLHPYFKDYVDLFDIDESFTDKHGYLDVDMGEEIMKSSMMISDYSSVVWDMFYLEKPVMFYQFDQADYLKSEGAYLDYEKDLFGDVVFNASDAIDTIISYADNDFQEKPAYASMRDKYMNFHDHNNAARIYKAILKKKKLLQIENDWTFSRKVARKLWKVKKTARNKFRK